MSTPDLEQLTIAYLLTVPAVAELVGDRISSSHPSDTAEPWIRVWLLDDDPIRSSPAQHLIDGLLQLEAYAGNHAGRAQETARAIAGAIREALRLMPAAAHVGAVVTSARASMTRQPDEAFAPARERYVLTATIFAHRS